MDSFNSFKKCYLETKCNYDILEESTEIQQKSANSQPFNRPQL